MPHQHGNIAASLAERRYAACDPDNRLIAAQLYQVKGWDPLVLAGSIAALAVSALLASIIPARRAASINPVNALRSE